MYYFFVDSRVKGLIVNKSKVKSILTRISTKNYNQLVFNCGYIYGLAKVHENSPNFFSHLNTHDETAMFILPMLKDLKFDEYSVKNVFNSVKEILE